MTGSACVLAACGSLNTIDSNGQIKGEVKWPKIEKNTFNSTGTQSGAWDIEIGNVDKIKVGMNKDQIYNLINRPHHQEGFVNVKEWNYTFNKMEDNQVKHCQFKITFDKNYNVATTMWKPVDCMVEVPKEMPVIAKPEKRFELRSDFLFDFDSATLRPEGVTTLNQVANEIARQNKLNEVVIVGHTDRLGSEEYNNSLSQKRASTVASYLAAKGVAPYKMKAYGAGENYPVKECAGDKPTPELKACLVDNRRVEISVK